METSKKRLTVLAQHISAFKSSLSSSAALQPVSVSKQSEIGKAAEQLLQKLKGGEFQKLFRTSLGRRFVDVWDPSTLTGFESKVGTVSASKHSLKQLHKDLDLIRTGKAKSIEWHNFRNKAGQGGMTPEFRNKFEQANQASGGKMTFVEHPRTAEEHAAGCKGCWRSSKHRGDRAGNDLSKMGRLGAVGGSSGAAVAALAYEMLCKHLQHEVSSAERLGLGVGSVFAPILGAAAGKTMAGVSSNVLISKLAAFSAGFVVGAAVTLAGGLVGLLIHNVQRARDMLQQTRAEITEFKEKMVSVLSTLEADIKDAEETLVLAEQDLNDIEQALKSDLSPEAATKLQLKTYFWNEALASLTGHLVECSNKAHELAQVNRKQSDKYAQDASDAYSAAQSAKDNRDVSIVGSVGAGFLGVLFAPLTGGASLALTGGSMIGGGATSLAFDDIKGSHESRERELWRARDDAGRRASEATEIAERARASLEACKVLHEKSKHLEEELVSKL